MKAILLALCVVSVSACATPHPAWRATGIALGAALVAGSVQNHEASSSTTSSPSDQRVPGVPCASNPALCK